VALSFRQNVRYNAFADDAGANCATVSECVAMFQTRRSYHSEHVGRTSQVKGDKSITRISTASSAHRSVNANIVMLRIPNHTSVRRATNRLYPSHCVVGPLLHYSTDYNQLDGALVINVTYILKLGGDCCE